MRGKQHKTKALLGARAAACRQIGGGGSRLVYGRCGGGEFAVYYRVNAVCLTVEAACEKNMECTTFTAVAVSKTLRRRRRRHYVVSLRHFWECSRKKFSSENGSNSSSSSISLCLHHLSSSSLSLLLLLFLSRTTTKASLPLVLTPSPPPPPLCHFLAENHNEEGEATGGIFGGGGCTISHIWGGTEKEE